MSEKANDEQFHIINYIVNALNQYGQENTDIISKEFEFKFIQS